MADYNTQQRHRNTIVGGFVIIAFCALIWMIAMFGELPVMATEWTSYEITAEFPQSAGIHKTTPVRYVGYPVGKVTQVAEPQFNLVETPQGKISQPKVTVRIAIDQDYSMIPANVKVRLTTRSMGSSYIELLPNDEEPVPMEDGSVKFLTQGMRLEGYVGAANEFIPEHIQDKLEVLVVKVTDLTTNLNDVLGDVENKKNIQQTLAHIADVTRQAGDAMEKFTSMTEQAGTTLGDISDLTDRADDTLVSIEDLSHSTKNAVLDTVSRLDDALVSVNNILHKIDQGEGTTAKMLNDGKLYENLLDSTKELENALQQFKNFAEEARRDGLKIKL
ncbi:virulence factor Mce family protein [Anaerohalosphaera lusitana]|uniref:Virulence factor Mce family protein n=1 Tax=Anaerohalosphaera lusitana TaxID=1936003 RepID=A0A1U9NL29_9BACT|nr:MlaD family protein [Anaerohalosphaera lusitana]AQT68619.1 virulence factor Mce family protein [Anaerohalosphaera lusitana]